MAETHQATGAQKKLAISQSAKENGNFSKPSKFENSHHMHHFEFCTHESISRIYSQFLAQNVRMEILNQDKKVPGGSMPQYSDNFEFSGSTHNKSHFSGLIFFQHFTSRCEIWNN